MGPRNVFYKLLSRKTFVGVAAAAGLTSYSYSHASRRGDESTLSSSLPSPPIVNTMKQYLAQLRMNVFAADQSVPEESVWDDNWDNRKQVDDGSEKKLSRRHLLLIRHGQYNMRGKDDSERYLTDLGREQAAFTAKRLREFGHKYDLLHASTMQRAMETAAIISKELEFDSEKIQHFDSIREGWPTYPVPESTRRGGRPDGNAPPLNGDADEKPDEKLSKTFSKELRRYELNGESDRIERAFRTIFYRPLPNTPDTVEIYVCHANVIRYFVCRALQIDPHAWLRFSLAHASVTHMVILSNGRVVAQAIGEAGHIPADKRSF